LVLNSLVLIVADSLGASLAVGVLLSFVIVATIGYLLHARFTFRQRVGGRAFSRYVFAMTANIPLSYVAVWFWHDALSLPMAVAAPVASICMLGLNFVLGHWAIGASSSSNAKDLA
jgi:putative flippase GtrA